MTTTLTLRPARPVTPLAAPAEGSSRLPAASVNLPVITAWATGRPASGVTYVVPAPHLSSAA